jgi:hypothetical protein
MSDWFIKKWVLEIQAESKWKKWDNWLGVTTFLRQLGVNFTNILRAPFSYVSFARSFFVLVVKVKLFICKRILAQLRQKMLVKLTIDSRVTEKILAKA